MKTILISILILLSFQASARSFLGLGIHLWVDEPQEERLETMLSDLNVKYARFTVGPHWQKFVEVLSNNPTQEEMDAFVENYFNGDSLQRLSDLKKTQKLLSKYNIKTLMVQFGIPSQWEDAYGEILEDKIETYALFLSSLFSYLQKESIYIDYIETSNEPDGNWDTKIPPQKYAKLVSFLSKNFARRNIKTKIAGPGLALISSAPSWLAALDSSDAKIEVLSLHAWDQKMSKEFDLLATSEWAQKNNIPLFISEFADGRYFKEVVSPDLSSLSVSDSLEFALRVIENSIRLINQGANALFYWEAIDQVWHNMSWGLLDRVGNKRPCYDALKIFYSNLFEAEVLTSDDKDQVLILRDKHSLQVIALNMSDEAIEKKIQLSDLQGRNITKIENIYSPKTEALLKDGALFIQVPAKSFAKITLR